MKTESEPLHPAAEDLEVLDLVASGISPQDADLQRWFDRYRQQHRLRLAHDLGLVGRSVSAGARVLECGAVPLLATAALAHKGYEVDAVDVAPERFDEAIRTLDLRVARCDIEAEALPYSDETFDLVLFNEIFEHLRLNPILTLREVRRVLKPGGWLLLSTPNLRSFRGLRNLLAQNRAHAVSGGVFEQYEKLETLGHMGHVREYTTLEVCEFLERLKLHPETLVFRGGHGRGIVGLAERLLPRMRPFFSVLARRGEIA